ncbi:MAG: 2,3-bisphosphoglycerate-independent phosphoglycerate mutase [Firmicutes bacterium]|nr:2,3-bisphosphoglycerate-independent phosphoglycerate mutase [Bacillota bacterium]
MSLGTPIILIILDGGGESKSSLGNAIQSASTPHFQGLTQRYAYTKLKAFGEEVGLPEGQMGNSEVGHLNIGAGRIVYQDITRIDKAISEGVFFRNRELLKAIQYVNAKKSALHLMGLVSDGGVHSHLRHLYALLELARKDNVKNAYIHAILDGRDVPPASAEIYLKQLEEKCFELGVGQIATVSGRYWAMDRDQRWERTEKAYRAYVYGEGQKAANALEAVQQAYRRGESDEFVEPTIIVDMHDNPLVTIKEDHSLIFFNFRPDRARQITRTFTVHDFNGFDRGERPPFPYYLCFTEYDRGIKAPVAFPPEYLVNTLGEVLSRAGLKQLRIAETEKYAHVTFFFNGGREKPFDGEERCMIPSPQVPTYDLQPEMSAPELTSVLVKAIYERKYDFILANYANADMVGHTGDLVAAIKAVEAVDNCLGKVIAAVEDVGGIALVTADHGNAEMMLDPDGKGSHTAHTANSVPFIIVSQKTFTLRSGGILADIAPTVLELFDLPQPEEMGGKSLISGG